MKKKEVYSEAEINVIMLQSTDVISTSGFGNEGVLDKDAWT